MAASAAGIFRLPPPVAVAAVAGFEMEGFNSGGAFVSTFAGVTETVGFFLPA